MKTNKSTKIFAVLFVLLAALTVTGCSNASSSGDDKKEEKEKTYKVELGDLAFDDYEEYQDWRFNGNPVISYDVLKDKRDELYSKTLDGTYQDKGSLSASDLKAFLKENGQEEEVASDAISFAENLGNEITVLFRDKTYATITWVYIEK